MKQILILLVATIIAGGGCSRTPSATSEYERGRAEATADLKAGSPRYLRVGPPPSADSTLAAILKRDYGVTLVERGCLGGGEHTKGYNEVVLDALNRRFGTDIIKAAYQEDLKQRERLQEEKQEDTNQ